MRLCWSEPHQFFSHTTKDRLVLPQLCCSCLRHTWHSQSLQHLQCSFCSSSLITNSNWPSWDISRMNPWSAASSGFDFALVSLIQAFERGPCYSVGQTRARRTFLPCGKSHNQSHKISNGLPECKCLLWSKPWLISSSVTQTCVIPFWWLSACEGRCCPPQHSPTCTCARVCANPEMGGLMQRGLGGVTCSVGSWSSEPRAVGLETSDWRLGECGVCSISSSWDCHRLVLQLLSCNQELPSKN